MKRSGLKASGSGYALGSRSIALANQDAQTGRPNKLNTVADVPHIAYEYCALGYAISVTDHLLVGGMGDALRRHRLPAENLHEQGIDIGEIWPIGERWHAIATDGSINLRARFRLELRMKEHCENECGQGRDGLLRG
jgi:hypothetical protein